METQHNDPWLHGVALREGAHVTTSEFDRFYGISSDTRSTWAMSDYSVRPLFPATLDLMLGSLQVAQLDGIVAEVSEHDEDVRGLHVMRFKEGKVKEAR